VTDTGVFAQTNTFITHLDEVEAFLRERRGYSYAAGQRREPRAAN
jgi:hypothetical protein